jgi:hypothetical protein
MKIWEFTNLEGGRNLSEAGVGKIVKGVNTTVDVQPGETQRQAAKFGNHVDGEGRPPELHSRARKNSDPNTLYNLGLAESMTENTDLLPPLADLIIMAVLGKTTVGVLVASIKAGKNLLKIKKLATQAGVKLSDRLLGEELSRAELLANIDKRRKENFYQAAVDALHRLVTSKGDRQTVSGYAFDIARAFQGINVRELEARYNELYG